MQVLRTAPFGDDFSAFLQEQFPLGNLSLETFVKVALYDREWGYYRAGRPRIGTSGDRDFYTAASLGKVFYQLIGDAAVQLAGRPASELHFVELGVEPGQAAAEVFLGSTFQSVTSLGLGDEQESRAIPSPAVVFSNELFDAQPFRRLQCIDGRWHEHRLAWLDGRWHELVAAMDPVDICYPLQLPASHPHGYLLDLPTGSLELLKEILAQQWQGLFLTLDYGLEWRDLIGTRPQGTARTYRHHTMGTDILEEPGQRDITCHLDWTAMELELGTAGFSEIRRVTQETLFVRYAQNALSEIASSPDPLGDKRKLIELINPGHFGHKFQALWGKRY